MTKPKTRRKPTSKTGRWQEAASDARAALEKLSSLKEDIESELRDEWIEAARHLAEVVARRRAEFQAARDELDAALGSLRDVKEEYQEWYDNMPDGPREGATGEKLSTICDMDLEPELPEELVVKFSADEQDLMNEGEPDWTVEIDLDAVETAVDEAEGADLPAGYGRD